MLAITLILLTVSALVSGSEVAFFSLTPKELQRMSQGSDPRDRLIVSLLSNVDRLLATILVTNNLVNICIVILSSNVMNSLWHFARYEFLFKTVFVTFLLLLFGEILPKVLAQTVPIPFARAVAYPVRAFSWLCYPATYVLIRAGGRLSRLATHNVEISMEDLADAVDLTRTSSNEEHKMLSGIVNMVNTEVEEIMRPRIDITALDMNSGYDEVKRVIIGSGYSRIPVYDEDLDDIKGALYVKDLLPYINRGDDFEWQKLLRKIYFVPKHKKIDDLLRDFQENKIHVAIVVDEYGATQGLVVSVRRQDAYCRFRTCPRHGGRCHVRCAGTCRDVGGADARTQARPAAQGRHGGDARRASDGGQNGWPPCGQDKGRCEQ